MTLLNGVRLKGRGTLKVLTAGVLLLAFQMVPIPESLAAGGRPVLLLGDVDTEGTQALASALTSAGYEVTLVTPEYTWNGTNPPPDGFQCVVHINGATLHVPLPVPAQVALVDFVRSGGCYIGGQYNGWEQVQGYQVDMKDLVLQLWPSDNPGLDNCFDCDMTWTQVPGQEGHPVLNSVPPSFTFHADAHDAGPLAEFDEDPSTVLMTSPGGGPAVIVREFEGGRVASFSSAANTATVLTLQDFNILALYVNAVDWASNAPPPVSQCNAPETITPRDPSISFTATSSGGADIGVEITNYDCFFINGAGKRVDKTRSCSVSYFGDTITIDKSGGVGTHITWTAVAFDGIGNMGDEVLCEIEVVKPGKGKGKGKWKGKGKCKGKGKGKCKGH